MDVLSQICEVCIFVKIEMFSINLLYTEANAPITRPTAILGVLSVSLGKIECISQTISILTKSMTWRRISSLNFCRCIHALNAKLVTLRTLLYYFVVVTFWRKALLNTKFLIPPIFFVFSVCRTWADVNPPAATPP